MPRIVDHALQRYELSATVAAVIARSGLENSTLRSVAAYHGCTKGMVQHYFKDKEELLLAALVYVEDRFNEAMTTASEGLQSLDRVHAVLHGQLPQNAEGRRDWQVRLAFYSRPEPEREMRELLAYYRARQHNAITGGLRQAQQAGELHSNLSLINNSRSLHALLWGLGVSAITDSDRTPASARRQILKAAVDNLRR